MNAETLQQMFLIPYQNDTASECLKKPLVSIPAEAVRLLDSIKFLSVFLGKQYRSSESSVNMHPHIIFVTYAAYPAKIIDASGVGGPCRRNGYKRSEAFSDILFYGLFQQVCHHAESVVCGYDPYPAVSDT